MSNLCTAVNTPASDDWGPFWQVLKKQKKLATCDKAVDWMSGLGNAGVTKTKWNFKATTAQVTDTTVNVSVRMVPGKKTTIKMTRPLWPHMTAYETAALDEMMRRLEAHEMGHVQVLAEVARKQTGTELIDTTVTSVKQWVKQWRQDSNSLEKSTNGDGGDYDDVTSHGVTQSELGGLNTTVQICDPVAAIKGDVPDGAVNSAYTTVLRLDKANPDAGDIVITNPVVWAVTNGALPPGINLAEGTLSGTPTQAGQFTFTVRATDANGLTADRDITLTVNGANKVTLLEQDYSVSGLISVANTGHAQACHGAGFGLTSHDAAGYGTGVEYDLTSTTDRFACHAPPPTAVDPAGVPAEFAHNVSVSATAGICTRSGAAALDAGIDPGPGEAGLAMRATASVTGHMPNAGLCAAAIDNGVGAGVTFTFEVIGGTAEFTWNVSQCVRDNWPPGFPGLADVGFRLYQGTDQLAAQTCPGSTFGASPMTLDPGTYQLRIDASFNSEHAIPTNALGMISATASIVPN